MAITFIYAVKSTGENSLNYDTEDKETKLVDKKKNDSQDSLNYIMQDKKGNVYSLPESYMEKMKKHISYDEHGNVVFHTVKTGLNCSVGNAYEQWKVVRNTQNPSKGNKGNLQYCIVQNFGTDIDPEIANEIGVKFAKEYLSNYQCVVSTHINTGYVHNHIEFNATSLTGAKYNDNLKSIGDIRKISDRLCKEYGLDVLEDTAEMRLVFYKDSQGQLRTYEPTDRKNEKLEGEFSDKNDYRNYEQYVASQELKGSHADILKSDIQKVLPYVTDYEDLLKKLEELGYKIQAKTKNGDWRKHISFTYPSWGKAVRDSQLGEEYEREQLTEKIKANTGEKKNEEKKIEPEEQKKFSEPDVKKSDIYVYGRIIIEEIDEEYRYKKGGKEKVSRSPLEKSIIADTKAMNREINAGVRSAMRPARENIQTLADGTKKQQYLINRINNNLKTLRFVEDRELKSFQQITGMVGALCEKRNACYKQLHMVSLALKKANYDLALIDKYNELKKRVENQSGDAEYELYEKDNDLVMLKSCEESLKRKGLSTPESQEEFRLKYQKYSSTFKQLTQAMEKINVDIREYDDCIYNLNVVDQRNGRKYKEQIEAYYRAKEEYKEQQEEEQNKGGR